MKTIIQERNDFQKYIIEQLKTSNGYVVRNSKKDYDKRFAMDTALEDVRNFGSKDIIGASNPGLYHDHENNQYQHETQIS